MRKLALIMTAFGFVAFAGVARADKSTENSVKTDTSTTLSGKKKMTTDKTVQRADGSKVETKTETVYPKADDRKDVADRNDDHVRDDRVRDDRVREDRDVRNTRNDDTEAKVEHKTTLTGKKQTEAVKKNADGSETTTTTTRTEPDHDKK